MDNTPVGREEAKDLNMSNYRFKQTIKIQQEKTHLSSKQYFLQDGGDLD